MIQAIKRLQYYEKQEQPFSKTARYSILDFLGLLACQIQSTYESLVYYYGIYSSSYRGKDKKEEIETELEQVEEWGKRDTINLKVSSSYARLIKKIFEIDPLQCPVCKAEMRIIAFITDYQEVRKIFKYIGKETIRPPPLLSDEAPEVTYEPATYFASTMVEFQTRI